MPPNIYIVGAQCTGKTTLIKALENNLSTRSVKAERHQTQSAVIITEVARTVMREIGFDRDDITSSRDRAFQLQKLILQRQAETEANLTADKVDWYISDRSGIDPIVYTKLHVGETEAEELLGSDWWKSVEHKMRQSVVIVCEAGCDWLVEDEFRVMPEKRQDWMDWHFAFLELLDNKMISYHIIPASMTDINDRVKSVLASWRIYGEEVTSQTEPKTS